MLPLSQDERAIRRIILPLRELTKRNLAKAVLLDAGRLGGKFASSLRKLEPEATVFSPLFLPILPWLDLIQGLGLRFLYDLTWNPFLVPPSDPRYLWWGENEGLMAEVVQARGLDLDARSLVDSASARLLDLRTILGRVDDVLVPTETLAQDFRAKLLRDYIWQEEIPHQIQRSTDGPLRVVWQGSQTDSAGLPLIWSETVKALAKGPQAVLECLGPLPPRLAKEAETSGVSLSIIQEQEKRQELSRVAQADILFASHPSHPFYDRLSCLNLEESIFASGGQVTFLGLGPVAHQLVQQYGGVEVEGKQEWSEKLEWLLRSKRARKAHRPSLAPTYAQAKDLGILLERRVQ